MRSLNEGLGAQRTNLAVRARGHQRDEAVERAPLVRLLHLGVPLAHVERHEVGEDVELILGLELRELRRPVWRQLEPLRHVLKNLAASTR